MEHVNINRVINFVNKKDVKLLLTVIVKMNNAINIWRDVLVQAKDVHKNYGHVTLIKRNAQVMLGRMVYVSTRRIQKIVEAVFVKMANIIQMKIVIYIRLVVLLMENPVWVFCKTVLIIREIRIVV